MHAPRKFDPINWQRLLSPERRALLDPGAVLDRIAVVPGSAVADIGAEPGFFTVPLAERVGPAGRVIALDVSPAMIVRRILAPGGRLAVLEWVPQDEPIGPPRHERTSASDAARLLSRNGFVIDYQSAANPSNYLLVAR